MELIMTATVKKSVKSAATKSVGVPVQKKALMICTHKTEKDLLEVNAYDVAQVLPSEIVAGDNAKAHLCLNIMAGNVEAHILEAHGKRGGLKRLFPGMANAEANALRVCLDAKPETLIAGWNNFTAKAKRVRNISIQALAKSIKEPSGETKVTLKDTLAAWCEENAKALNAKTFPVSLYDIFTEFGIVETEADDADE